MIRQIISPKVLYSLSVNIDMKSLAISVGKRVFVCQFPGCVLMHKIQYNPLCRNSLESSIDNQVYWVRRILVIRKSAI